MFISVTNHHESTMNTSHVSVILASIASQTIGDYGVLAIALAVDIDEPKSSKSAMQILY